MTPAEFEYTNTPSGPPVRIDGGAAGVAAAAGLAAPEAEVEAAGVEVGVLDGVLGRG